PQSTGKVVEGAAKPQPLAKRDALFLAAQMLRAQGRTAEALAAMEHVLAIERQIYGDLHDEAIGSLKEISDLALVREDFTLARKEAEERLTLATKLHGEHHWQTVEARLARDYVERAARLSPPWRRALAESKQLEWATLALYQQGQFREALGPAQRALELSKQVMGEAHLVYPQLLNNLAAVYQGLGDPARAVPLFRRAIEINRAVRGEAHPYSLATLNNLAAVYHKDMGDYGAAEPLYLQARDSAKRLVEESRSGRGFALDTYATALSNLAALYQELVRFDLARQSYQEASRNWRKAIEEGGTDLDEVRKHLNVCEANRVTMDLMLARYDDAEKSLLEALEFIKTHQGETHPDCIKVLNNLAVACTGRDDLAGAERYLLQAIAIQEKTPGEALPDYALSLGNLGILSLGKGEYARAETLLQRAIETWKRVGGESDPNFAASLTCLALVHQALGRPRQALETLGHAMELEQAGIDRVFGFTSEQTMLTYTIKASISLDLLISLAFADQAIEPSAAGMAMDWALRRKGAVLDVLCRYRDLQHLRGRDPATAERVGRLRQLRQALSAFTLAPPPGVSPESYSEQLAELRRQADALEAELNRTLSAQRPATAGPLDTIDAATVRRCLPPDSALVEVVRTFLHDDFKDMRKEPTEHYIALVLPAGPEAPVRLLDLGDAAVLDQGVAAVRQHIKDFDPRMMNQPRSEQAFREVAVALERLAFAPLRTALGSASLIFFAPDGELNRVAFESLVDDAGKYLVESYRFAYLSSGRDLLVGPMSSGGRGTVVFAGPDFDLDLTRRDGAGGPAPAPPRGPDPGGDRSATRPLQPAIFVPLPGAADEAEAVTRALQDSPDYDPVRVYLGREAREELFKAIHAPRILHIATHGFYQPPRRPASSGREKTLAWSLGAAAPGGIYRLGISSDPLLRSGLALAGANTLGASKTTPTADDGWLMAQEIATLDLNGTELVVLSACESGLGAVQSGEGIFGLRRAFRYAGARTLLTSLYSVPDLETLWLMSQFYDNLKNKEGKLDALRHAQLKMIQRGRERYGSAHPFYWASFVLVGDPR
ncbi:MAG: CHAT domain-containing protein, partial [Acidimicrobiales bacterium]|nr:CHAT domain-containing protein [Acidimicrobiales bacterium]